MADKATPKTLLGKVLSALRTHAPLEDLARIELFLRLLGALAAKEESKEVVDTYKDMWEKGQELAWRVDILYFDEMYTHPILLAYSYNLLVSF